MDDKTNFTVEYMEHLMEPKNYGSIENYSAKGVAKSANNEELVEIYLDIKNNLINDIKYQAIGCTTTIVGGSLFTSTIKGESIQEAVSVADDILKKLLEADAKERICGEMVAKSFLAAVENYNNRISSDELEVVVTLQEDCPIE